MVDENYHNRYNNVPWSQLFQQDNLRKLFYYYLVVFQMDKKYKYRLFQFHSSHKDDILYGCYLLRIH